MQLGAVDARATSLVGEECGPMLIRLVRGQVSGPESFTCSVESLNCTPDRQIDESAAIIGVDKEKPSGNFTTAA